MTRVLSIGAGFVLGALTVLPALAQAPAPPKPDAPPSLSAFVKAQVERDEIAEQLAGVTAQLTLCRGQLAPQVYQQNLQEVETDRQKIVRDFEAANPGWTIDLKTLAISKKPDKKGGGDGR